MTVKDHMEIMELRRLGMHEADAKACMQHVIDELKQDSLFQEYSMHYHGNIWEQPIQNFKLDDLFGIFEGYVVRHVLRWLTYRYYDALDDIEEFKKGV